MKRPADRAWAVLIVGIISYELMAPKGELLSEGVDRAMARHPWWTRFGVAVVGLHLVNALPWWADPIHLLAKSFGTLKNEQR